MAIPYKELNEQKKTQVKLMFNSIARRYDFLNHFLSLGIDKRWRSKAINILTEKHPSTVLDIATGTADFAIRALKLNPERIIGIDISPEMLKIGQEKLQRYKVQNRITLMEGDAENLPFENESFDAVISAFGVRNFENLNQGLKEIYRVLKPAGELVILEFSKPGRFFNFFFNVYFNKLLPLLGRLVSKDMRAYTYLPESVSEFPQGVEFTDLLKNQIGFMSTKSIRLTFGICTIYHAIKRY